MSLLLHPDKNKDPQAQEAFKLVNLQNFRFAKPISVCPIMTQD